MLSEKLGANIQTLFIITSGFLKIFIKIFICTFTLNIYCFRFAFSCASTTATAAIFTISSTLAPN